MPATGGSLLPAWRALPPPRPGLRAIVVVPARDESAHLGAALAALLDQRDAASSRIDGSAYEVLVFANNCSDGSAELARGAATNGAGVTVHVVEASLPPSDSHIGYVRRQLMDAACERLASIGEADSSIASTDADSVVARDWLHATLAEVASGADAVGGRIRHDASVVPGLQALRRQRIDLAHALLRSRIEDLIDPDPADPWPRHHQHFGASLAVRARCYREVGGVPQVEHLEDIALVDAMRSAGMRIRHSPRVRVTTSSRHDGRAEVGLSWQLRQWDDRGSRWHDRLVEPATRHVEALRAYAFLRAACSRRPSSGADGDGDGRWAHAEAALRLPPGRLAALVRAQATFGALRAAVESERQRALERLGEMIPMSAAIDGFRGALRALLAAQAKRRAGTTAARAA